MPEVDVFSHRVNDAHPQMKMQKARSTYTFLFIAATSSDFGVGYDMPDVNCPGWFIKRIIPDNLNRGNLLPIPVKQG